MTRLPIYENEGSDNSHTPNKFRDQTDLRVFEWNVCDSRTEGQTVPRFQKGFLSYNTLKMKSISTTFFCHVRLPMLLVRHVPFELYWNVNYTLLPDSDTPVDMVNSAPSHALYVAIIRGVEGHVPNFERGTASSGYICTYVVPCAFTLNCNVYILWALNL